MRYDSEIAAALLEQMSEGASMPKAARAVNIKPSDVYGWLDRAEPEGTGRFKEDYQIACKEREQYWVDLADELFEKARAVVEDSEDKRTVDENGVVHVEPRNVRWAELQAKTYMAQAAKLNSRKYGDLLKSELSGPNGSAIPIDLKDVKTEALVQGFMDMAKGKPHLLDALKRDGVL